MNKIIEKIKEYKVGSFILRHSLWLTGLIVGITVLSVIPGLTQFLIFVAMMESIALGLSMLALYAYTNINYTRKLSSGDDMKFSSTEQYAYQRVIASVFIGVHVLVAICTLVVYSGTFIR